jgi:branched-chain amino acid transport system permease protein
MQALSNVLAQLINGLSGATTLFLVGAGLSIIFGVSRIVNFAHGSFYMVGIYTSYSLSEQLAAALGGQSALTFWSAIICSALIVAVLGALIEVTVMRRIYAAPELFQLLATFALTLIIKDLALTIWGAEDLLGPKAPHLGGAIDVFGRPIPQYDLLLTLLGPLVLLGLWLLLTKTRWGLLIRAATQDRDMLAALGVNQKWLFTSVFALGSFLAALGGGLQLPREPANLNLDVAVIGDAFVVVVVGGLGSIPGAFLAALFISIVKALCIGIGTINIGSTSVAFSKLTLVAEFVVMAAVLIWRPWGLLGRPQSIARSNQITETPLRPLSKLNQLILASSFALALALPLLASAYPYAVVLAIDVLIAILFAQSLQFMMGPAGMHSFGHAAYFGLGAYGAALAVKQLGLPMELALLVAALTAAAGAALFGWFCVRLSGVYLAMLTLAFAQIVWSIVFQGDDLTGGSNGLTGIWPSDWLQSKPAFYYLTLTLVSASVALLVAMLHSPFGYAMRATRDSTQRSAAIGVNKDKVQWITFIVAGFFAGLAGALFAFSKGTISPDTMAVSKSVDGLVMVLLGGIQSLAGGAVGASLFVWLQDTLMRETEYWRAGLGVVILALVLLFPGGIVGGVTRAIAAIKPRPEAQHKS